MFAEACLGCMACGAILLTDNLPVSRNTFFLRQGLASGENDAEQQQQKQPEGFDGRNLPHVVIPPIHDCLHVP